MLSITISLHELSPLLSEDPRSWQVMDRAAEAVGGYVYGLWTGAVQGNVLPGMSRAVSDPDYAASIQVSRPDALTVQLSTGLRSAERVEYGRPWVDLKPGLLSSPKARIGKRGQRYITVPLSHGSPRSSKANAMPWGAYQTFRRYGMIPKGSKWYEEPRETKVTPAGEYTWQAGKYRGLTATPSDRGTGKNNQYLTFRTVSDNSSPASWWLPPVPANPVVDAVRRQVEQNLDRIIEGVLG